jgi:beta-N-acetylhexosaminidase
LHLDEPGTHIFAGFNGTCVEDELRYLISEYRPGGIVLFRRNIQGREQVKELVAAAQAIALEELNHPLLVCIDQEGGLVQRLDPHYTRLPAAQALAAEGPQSVTDWARISARDLKQIGIHINFAPVLDIIPEGENHFMDSRCFGSTPETVAELGRLWIEALQNNGISATGKHFPGLGRAELDPHHFAPVINKDSPEEFRRHLVPFEAAVKAGVHCMMSSHAVYPAIDPDWPATLSLIINSTWLRDRLGFGGILFSDDLDMAAISEKHPPREIVDRGLCCGTDFFLLCQKSENIEPFFSALTDQVAGRRVIREAHENSIKRITDIFRFHFAGAFL